MPHVPCPEKKHLSSVTGHLSIKITFTIYRATFTEILNPNSQIRIISEIILPAWRFTLNSIKFEHS